MKQIKLIATHTLLELSLSTRGRAASQIIGYTVFSVQLFPSNKIVGYGIGCYLKKKNLPVRGHIVISFLLFLKSGHRSIPRYSSFGFMLR